MRLSRRDLLKLTLAAGLGAGTAVFKGRSLTLNALQTPVEVGNPLEYYPERDWEAVYRDQYHYDGSFTYVCSPNDTHACRVKAFVKNGVVLRVEQNYDVKNYADIFGNTATPSWHPRMCLKGYTFPRRVYGPYRLKQPLIRRGWKQWADDGFPELTEEKRSQYLFDARGQDELLPISWEETYDYIARGMMHIAQTYSGAEGAQRLRDQGYPEEMISAMGEAGTRAFKLRGGMGLLGVIGKYGMYRFSNMLALLDAHIRGIDEQHRDNARGGRTWSNYTWHGDQAPGQPWVHGLQASDCDFNDLRFSKLIIQNGKNLVENKMPESHFFIECMERGAKLVVITPEYGPPATKADYWIPIRPATDAAFFLGITRYMIDNNLYDEDFVKKLTDFPFLVRTDTLQRLKAHEVFPGYQNEDISSGASMTIQGLKPEQRERIGDFVVWDKNTNSLKAITRDDVGEKLATKGIDPTLELDTHTITTADGAAIEVMTIWEMYKVHLQDYDLDTVVEITHAPRDLIIQLAQDIASIKPVAIHQGEGINHWFHATEMNRASHLPLMLTGNFGIPGAGCHTWSGNYKAALFQGSSWSGPGFKG